MSSAISILPYYTYDDYCKWEGRWEIIKGIPFAMSPAPSPRHQWLASNIIYELKDALKKIGCKNCKVYDFIDIHIHEDTIVQPDVLVVCKEITKPYLDFPAALVVEILSPSTAMKDRNNKFYIYQSQKIPYYLIIDPDKNTIEIFALNNEGKYEVATFVEAEPFRFDLDEDCKVDVVLSKIWS
jgi:Uma2 family endonuclease